MNLILFCTAFILQFVGHRLGDYLFQTDWQAQNKAKSALARNRHVIVYSTTIAALLLIAFDWNTVWIIWLLTYAEHMFIDSRKPVVGYKRLLERLVGNKSFDIDKMPFFVLIEIDQTIHYTRILILSIIIGYGII